MQNNHITIDHRHHMSRVGYNDFDFFLRKRHIYKIRFCSIELLHLHTFVKIKDLKFLMWKGIFIEKSKILKNIGGGWGVPFNKPITLKGKYLSFLPSS
jgi:hypothetical protein